MNLEITDDELDLILTALEHYHAYTVAKKAEDSRYRDLAGSAEAELTER
jgi:hypothetical protein